MRFLISIKNVFSVNSIVNRYCIVVILTLIVYNTNAQNKSRFSETKISIQTKSTNNTKTSNIEVVDNRFYTMEIGKLISFEKNKWIRLQLDTSLTHSISTLFDSLASQLNLNQHYLAKINSFYIQENKIKGISLRHLRLNLHIDFYAKRKNEQYQLVYTADSSHLLQSYLPESSLPQDIKNLLNDHLKKCKHSVLKSKETSKEFILKKEQISQQATDLFTETKTDGLYTTWQELKLNTPQFTSSRIEKIDKVGQLVFKDTSLQKKVKISLFKLYAYIKQGILYKCSNFGSFPLLNIQNHYFFVGLHERFYTTKPNAYQYQSIRNKGGGTITQEDMETQKYLFYINPETGIPMVICAITPADDYTNILMNLNFK